MKIYDLEEYITARGKKPFGDWLKKLKDKSTTARILARLDRVQQGNLGDHKSIKNVPGLYELREHHGAGYRVFFSIIDNKVVLLLAGSNKRDQQRVIENAKQYLADYERRS